MALSTYTDAQIDDAASRAVNRFMTASSQEPAPDHTERLHIQESIRDEIIGVAHIIEIELADSREKSLALTHLEEALMWAGIAIFRD